MMNMEHYLRNYRDLVRKVDQICARIYRDYEGDIACARGCDGCCIHFSIFPVEAVSLADAVRGLSRENAEWLRDRVNSPSTGDTCPLLRDGVCIVYPYRPIICRTHGLPILIGEGDSRVIDYCPMNFRHTENIPGTHVIDLELLNETLATVNNLFVRSGLPGSHFTSERIRVREALFLEL